MGAFARNREIKNKSRETRAAMDPVRGQRTGGRIQEERRIYKGKDRGRCPRATPKVE